MKAWFEWLVRHEKLVAAITGCLIIALVVEIKFRKTRVSPEADLTFRQPAATPAHPPVSSTTGISGKWEMTVQKKKGGTQTWTLTLEQNGEELKGVVNSEGGDLPVTGTIKGSAINLLAKRFGVTVEFPATLNGETMTGEMRALMVKRQWTAKRM